MRERTLTIETTTPGVDELSLSLMLLKGSLITSRERLPNDTVYASLFLSLPFLSPLPIEGIHLRNLLKASSVQNRECNLLSNPGDFPRDELRMRERELVLLHSG